MAYRSSSTNGTAAASLVITTPTGAASGDLLAAYLVSDGVGNTISAPDGTWTSGGSYNATDVTFATFYKVLSAAPDASYTFTINATAIIGGLIAVDLEGGSSPVVDTNGVATAVSTSVTTPTGIANVADPRAFIAAFVNDSTATVATPPASMTAAHSVVDTGAMALAAYYQDTPADGGDIQRTLVWSVSDTIAGWGLLVSWTAAGGGDPEGRLIGGKLVGGGLLIGGVLH